MANQGLLVFCIFASTCLGQNLCPAGVKSDKLVCLIPQTYGPNGLVLESLKAPQFQNDFLSSNLSPLNSEIARQSSLLPVASPSSGIRFTWDLASKTYVQSTDSFGPILGERADTIGKYKVAVSFGYQYFKFESLDGVSLNKLPAAFPQPDNTFNAPSGVSTCSATPPNSPANVSECAYIRDVITTSTRVDLKIHQYTTYITYGLTNRIDASIVIPIENIRMGVISDATLVNNSNGTFHTFPIVNDVCGDNRTDPIQLCLHKQFPNIRDVSGIGDITFRLKGTAWQGEKAGLALGVDVRMPTGDTLNFLGAGAFGVKPFLVWSYRARVAPHVSVGYEINGSSKIAGDPSTGDKEKLPGDLSYAAGGDVRVNRWLTGAFELVGQQVFQARRVSMAPFTDLGKCLDPSGLCDPNFNGGGSNAFDPGVKTSTLAQSTENLNISNFSVGAKVRPVGKLLFTANVLIRLNDSGLRTARFAPLVGLAYTF